MRPTPRSAAECAGDDVAVKICGVCRPEDAAMAAAAGAAYLGVILAPGRARSRTPAEAEAILSAGGDAFRVGVFVDAGHAAMVDAARRLRLDVVQLHGTETPEVARRVAEDTGAEVWKAVRVREAAAVPALAEAWVGAAHALLLDGWSPHGEGGVGARFDAVAVAAFRPAFPPQLALVAAGGLTPATVGDVIRLLAPAVVDVSSGVEESVGRKSAELVEAFIAAAAAAGLEDR